MRKLLNGFLDILFPPSCVLCGGISEHDICLRCRGQIVNLNGPYCNICGRPHDRYFSGDLCGECGFKAPQFEIARSVALYDNILKDAIHEFKFNNKKRLVRILGRMMSDYFKASELSNIGVDAVMPIPLSKERARKRGYNQSFLLAEQLSDSVGIKLDGISLKRIRDIAPQFELGRNERLLNPIGSFQALDINKTKVLLIDDIYTTGATVNEASRTLKAAGADKVFVLTLGRAVER